MALVVHGRNVPNFNLRVEACAMRGLSDVDDFDGFE